MTKIDFEKPQSYTAQFNEHRNELQDSRFNFMDIAHVQNLDFLNLEQIDETPYGLSENFAIYLKLGNRIHIQKRIVYDFLMMFGDVGGLNDFFVLLFVAIFSSFADKLMLRELAAKLFHFTNISADFATSPLETLASFKPLKAKKLFISRKRSRFLKIAQAKLDESLDVVRLIRAGRVHKTLLRLLLSKTERDFIKFQRCEAVIDEQAFHGSSNWTSDE